MSPQRAGVVAALSALLLAPAPGAALARAARSPYHFALAKLLIAEGSYGEALEAFEAAVAEAPDDAFLHRDYAEFAFRLAQGTREPAARRERLALAAVHSERARALAPADADVLRLAGRVLLAQAEEGEQGARERAREVFERLRAVAPDDPQGIFSLGQLYLDAGEPGLAADAFAELARRRPEHRMAHALMVDALLRAGRAGEAEVALRDLVGREPAALDARLRLTDLLAQRGAHQEAVATLRDAPAEQRTDREVRRRLALELYLTGELEEALAELAELAADPEAGGARYLQAVILAAQGRSAEAEAALRELWERAPEQVEVAVLLARMLERQGRFRDAADTLVATAARLAPEAARQAAGLRLQAALVLLRGDEPAAAQETLAPVLDSEVAEVADEAHLLLADILATTGRLEPAIAALEGRAGDAFIAKRAELLFQAGQAAAAETLLGELTAGGEASSLMMAAEVHQRREQYEQSIPLLEAALRSEPASAEAAFRLGAAYERLGERGAAMDRFRDLLAREPDFAPALNYLGYMLAERGESLQEAVELTSRAVALDPDNGAYVDSLGWAHFQRGEYGTAQSYLERAARLVPDDATVHEHLGDLYVAVGAIERARAVYRRAFELRGDNADQVRRKLETLDGER